MLRTEVWRVDAERGVGRTTETRWRLAVGVGLAAEVLRLAVERLAVADTLRLDTALRLEPAPRPVPALRLLAAALRPAVPAPRPEPPPLPAAPPRLGQVTANSGSWDMGLSPLSLSISRPRHMTCVLWLKNQAKPTLADKAVMIQKRITILFSVQPICSKWWCTGAIRKTRFRVSLK